MSFIENLQQSSKSLVKLIFTCSSNLRSLTGQNLAFLLMKYERSSLKELILEKQSIKTTRVYPLSREEDWKISLLEEISLLKLNLLEIEFDNDDLEEILVQICTE